MASHNDEAASCFGVIMVPLFLGEDFLMNAPEGLMFSGNLSGITVVILVESYPDNSPMQFVLKALSNTVANPSGTVTR